MLRGRLIDQRRCTVCTVVSDKRGGGVEIKRRAFGLQDFSSEKCGINWSATK
jgi:hypothetical protein